MNKCKECGQIMGKTHKCPDSAWNKGLKGVQEAWNKGIKGSIKKNKTSFKKGMTPWNKGKTGLVSNPNKGKHITNSGSFKKGHKHIGANIGEIMKGKPSPFKGKKHSEEANEKNRIAHIGNTPWNKGTGNKKSENKRIRASIETSLWRESVFARDNWTCQKCNIKGGVLRPHHILNFAEHKDLRFAIDNGITLCDDCHVEFHKYYGYTKNTQKQIDSFISQAMAAV